MTKFVIILLMATLVACITADDNGDSPLNVMGKFMKPIGDMARLGENTAKEFQKAATGFLPGTNMGGKKDDDESASKKENNGKGTGTGSDN